MLPLTGIANGMPMSLVYDINQPCAKVVESREATCDIHMHDKVHHVKRTVILQILYTSRGPCVS